LLLGVKLAMTASQVGTAEASFLNQAMTRITCQGAEGRKKICGLDFVIY
jgi:hypothetical protein